MLKTLELKNWKSHKHTIIEFERGTNVLVGIMGAGKTSIFQAVVFALYGELPELRGKKLNLVDLIRNRPRFAGKAEVKLVFEHDGKVYTVKRSVSPEGSTAVLYDETSKILALGPRNVTEKIRELFGIDYEEFVNVFYVRQNELDSFLRAGKHGRVSLMDKLLKLEKIEEGLDALKEVRRELKVEISAYEAQKLRKPEEIKRDLEEIEKSLKEIEKREVALTEERKQLEKEYSEILSKIKVLKEKLKRKRDLESRADRIKGIVSHLLARLEKLPEGVYREGDLEKLEDEYNRFLEEYTSVKAELEKIDKASKEKEVLINKIKELEDILKIEVEGWMERVKKLEKKIMEVSLNIEMHRDALSLLKAGKQKCPVCGAPLKDPEEHIERHKKEIASLQSSLMELEEKIQKAKERARAEEELLKRKTVAEERLKELKERIGEIDKLLSEREEKLKKLEELRKKIVEVREKMETLKLLRERTELKNKLGRLKGELEEIKRSLKELRGVDEEYESAIKRQAEITKRIEGVQKVLDEILERKKREELLKKRLEDELKTTLRVQERLKVVRRAYEISEKLINNLKDLQIIVRNEFVELLNSVLNDTWQELYPYGDIRSIRLRIEQKGQKAGDYILEFLTSSGWRRIDGNASGGERTMAMLALRLALARIVGKLDFLLLDEPTHNLDSSGIDKLIEALKNASRFLINQLLVITHEERMEKAATALAYRVYREKAKDEPSKVEKLF